MAAGKAQAHKKQGLGREESVRKFICSKSGLQAGGAISNVVLMKSSCRAFCLHSVRGLHCSPLVSAPSSSAGSAFDFFSFCFPARDLKKNRIRSLGDNQFAGYQSLQKL